jgi:hypothetical protein
VLKLKEMLWWEGVLIVGEPFIASSNITEKVNALWEAKDKGRDKINVV